MVRDHFAYTLNMPAAREIVAELLFCGSLIPQVTWTQIGGYNENSTLLGAGSQNAYLHEEVFGLSADPNDYTGTGWGFDTRGRPQLVWKADRNPSTVRTAASNDYVLFVNGKTAVTSKYHVAAADTVGTEAIDHFIVNGTQPSTRNGNVYTVTTEAVYFRDYRTPGDNQWRVTYNPSYNWSQLGADVIAEQYDSATNTYDETRRFHLTPNSKVYGLGSNVVLAEGLTALEYLNHSNINWNDVAIVHESAYGAGTATVVFLVPELYIQTDPNWMPAQTPGVSAATAPAVGATGQHVFTVNFAGTANNAMGTPSGRLTMKAGTTCNFSITTVSLSGLVTLSSGSFTMA